MRLVILDDYDRVSEWAAKYVRNRILAANPGPNKYFVLGLPTGIIFKTSINYHCCIYGTVLYVFSMQQVFSPGYRLVGQKLWSCEFKDWKSRKTLNLCPTSGLFSSKYIASLTITYHLLICHMWSIGCTHRILKLHWGNCLKIVPKCQILLACLMPPTKGEWGRAGGGSC